MKRETKQLAMLAQSMVVNEHAWSLSLVGTKARLNSMMPMVM